MSRKPTSVDAEMASLSRAAAPPDYLARKSKLFASQTENLASRLIPLVGTALEREASSEIAAEYLKERAIQVLKGLPESPAGFEERAGFKQAAGRVRGDLTEQLLKDALRPATAEVEDHAYEIAQCVLSNWFSILERAKLQSPSAAVALSANGLPERVENNAVYRGVEAFALPVQTVASKFIEFLDSIKATGPVVELAPDLYFATGAGKAYVASSRNQANAVIAPQKQPDKPVITLSAEVYEQVEEFLQPVLDTAPGFWGRTTNLNPSFESLNLDAKLERAMAMAAAHEATDKTAEGKTVVMIGDTVVAVLADLALSEVNQAIYKNKNHKIMGYYNNCKSLYKTRTIEKMVLGRSGSILKEDDVPMCRRMAVVATGYAVSGGPRKTKTIQEQVRRAEEFMQGSPKAREVYDMVVLATRDALAKPEVEEIKVQLQQVIDLPR